MELRYSSWRQQEGQIDQQLDASCSTDSISPPCSLNIVIIEEEQNTQNILHKPAYTWNYHNFPIRGMEWGACD